MREAYPQAAIVCTLGPGTPETRRLYERIRTLVESRRSAGDSRIFDMAFANTLDGEGLGSADHPSMKTLSLIHICGDPETLTYTAQDGLYYGAFSQWKEEIAALYAAYAAVADKTAGAQIDSHRRIGADAYETRYTNGVRVLVNYADEPVDFEGLTISAQGYAVI